MTPRPVEVYGLAVAPRVRWSCPCGRRNDQPLAVPPDPKTVVVCRKCKRATVLSTTSTTTPAVTP